MNRSRACLVACVVWMAQACSSSSQHTVVVDNGDAGDGGASSSGSSSGSSSSGSSSGGSTDAGTSAEAASTRDAGGGDSASTTQGCSGQALCDDFESDTVGSPPSSSLWTLVGTAGCSGTGNPSAPILYPIVVDSSQHQSGSQSVKVTGGDSCGPLMINTSAFSQLTGGEVYGRFYVHLSDTTKTFDHTVLMALGLLTDGGVGLNIGDQSSYLQLASEGAGNATNVLMWQTTDGNILPNKNAMGGAESTYPAATGFTCVEFHTSVSGAIETWINGSTVAVPGLTSPPTPANATQWVPPSPFAPTSLGLGWIVFSGATPTVWYDDVALSKTRIFCP
jgi:hypothetical protein